MGTVRIINNEQNNGGEQLLGYILLPYDKPVIAKITATPEEGQRIGLCKCNYLSLLGGAGYCTVVDEANPVLKTNINVSLTNSHNLRCVENILCKMTSPDQVIALVAYSLTVAFRSTPVTSLFLEMETERHNWSQLRNMLWWQILLVLKGKRLPASSLSDR